MCRLAIVPILLQAPKRSYAGGHDLTMATPGLVNTFGTFGVRNPAKHQALPNTKEQAGSTSAAETEDSHSDGGNEVTSNKQSQAGAD